MIKKLNMNIYKPETVFHSVFMNITNQLWVCSIHQIQLFTRNGKVFLDMLSRKLLHSISTYHTWEKKWRLAGPWCLTLHLVQISRSLYLMEVALWYILSALTSHNVASDNRTQSVNERSKHDVGLQMEVCCCHSWAFTSGLNTVTILCNTTVGFTFHFNLRMQYIYSTYLKIVNNQFIISEWSWLYLC